MAETRLINIMPSDAWRAVGPVLAADLRTQISLGEAGVAHVLLVVRANSRLLAAEMAQRLANIRLESTNNYIKMLYGIVVDTATGAAEEQVAASREQLNQVLLDVMDKVLPAVLTGLKIAGVAVLA